MTDPESIYETPLPHEVFEERMASAIRALDGQEGTEIDDYLTWFARRYPTALGRIAYCRRKYLEAMRSRGAAR